MTIGLHVLEQPNLDPLLAHGKPPVMLYMNPPEHIPYKAPLTIGRIYVDNQQSLLATDPVGLGNRMANEAIASASKNGIEWWCGPNEPDVGSPEAIYRICLCEKIRVQRLNAAGLKAVVFNFSVGWPAENMQTRQLDVAHFQPFMDWLPKINQVGFHEYWYPSGPLEPASYDPLHPSRVWRFKYWPWPHKIFVTECGIDIGGNPATDGWRCFVPPGKSLEQWADMYSWQMHQYVQLISQDDRAEEPIVFCAGTGFGWGNYDILPEWRQFCWLWECDQPAPEPPPTPPGGGDNMSVFLPVDSRIPENLRKHSLGPDGKLNGSVVRIVDFMEAWKRWGHPETTLQPGAYYWKVERLEFIPEGQASDKVCIYIQALDENGIPLPVSDVLTFWPSNNLERANWIGQFDNGAGGNGQLATYSGTGEFTQGGNNFLQVVIGSDRVGPYCFQMQRDGPSDIAAGFGLVNNRHCEYVLVFKRYKWGQSGGGGEPPVIPPEPGVFDWERLARAYEAMAAKLRTG